MGTPSRYDTDWFSDADDLGKDEGLGARNTQQVADAKRLIADFVKRGAGGLWPKLDRAKIGAGLTKRLTNPDSFNQGDTFLCGIATFVRVWAFDHPLDYARLAIDLFEKGEGKLVGHNKYGGKPIRPSEALRNSPPARLVDGKEFDHSDWIVLASIREAFNDVFDYTSDEGIFRIRAWNFPSDVEREFKAAGYTKIVNKADGLKQRGYDNLMEATSLYEKGWRVILLVNDRLLNEKNIGSTAFINHSTHWIGLNSPIVIARFGDKPMVHPFKVYSWDGLYSIPRWNKPIPLTTMIPSYFGFVAGHV